MIWEFPPQKEDSIFRIAHSPCMPPGPCAPGPDAVVGADKVVAREHGIVPVGHALDEPPVDKRRPLVRPVVGRAQGIAEGTRRRRQERRRERARGALREERDARLESERELWERRRVKVRAGEDGVSRRSSVAG